MKTEHKGLLASVLGLAAACWQASGAFQNFGFESANLSPVPVGQRGGLVSISDAMPGWIGYAGTDQVSEVLHNNLSLGAAEIDIWGPDWTTQDGIIEGRYT